MFETHLALQAIFPPRTDFFACARDIVRPEKEPQAKEGPDRPPLSLTG